MPNVFRPDVEAPEISVLPHSVYSVKVASCDGKTADLLGSRQGKVTLVFNVAAGCGNIPQHTILEELHAAYKDEPDFDVLAIVVDDFVCHGYPEFQNGLEAYIEENGLTLTPGEVARNYGQENFGVTYEFSELTAGRFDKHTYASTYVPGELKLQDQHPLWGLLTGAWEADRDENGVPYHHEEIPWSIGQTQLPTGVKGYVPLRGNFEKFLISRDGRKIRRYANGFLLGERDWYGNTFPWVEERYQENGWRDYRPDHSAKKDEEPSPIPWPKPVQRAGIDVSLEMLKEHIDEFLAEPS